MPVVRGFSREEGFVNYLTGLRKLYLTTCISWYIIPSRLEMSRDLKRRRIEQLEVANRWEVAAPTHLVKELLSGRPTPDQRRAYSILLQAWCDSDWPEYTSASEAEVTSIERSLRSLNLRDDADRWHLAEAIALEASWFLTNDSDIIDKTRPEPNVIGIIRGVRVARPSECLRVLSANPVGGWSEHTC